MDKAKAAVSDFLHHNNKHSVDIEQETAPAVTHERVQKAQHENVTTVVDRETHQHHHQTHVQPLTDKVVEAETHHQNVLPVEHRKQHHGKDAEVARALEGQSTQFRDEREVLATQHSQSANTLVGEHVHHHIHDKIQPVVEREVIQPHVVHTTVPIHEHIEKAPVIHEGNVLPTKTLSEFQSSGGHSLTGGHHTREHIDYEGDPLNIKDNSRVGFSQSSRHEGLGSSGRPGELGTATGAAGAAGIIGEAAHHHHQKDTAGPHSSNVANKLDPRVDSDRDGSRTAGTTGTTGFGHGTSGTHHALGENITHKDSGYTTGTTGTSGTGLGTTPRTDAGFGNTAGTGLGSGTTGVSERANTTNTTTSTQSTTDKLLSKVGLK